jgi:hypothetical protein
MNVMLETAKTGARTTKRPFVMKRWFNEFLQNAAFPAMVLAFATSLINIQIREVRTGHSTDYRKAVRTQVSYIDPMMGPVAEKSYLKTESRNVTSVLSRMALR